MTDTLAQDIVEGRAPDWRAHYDAIFRRARAVMSDPAAEHRVVRLKLDRVRVVISLPIEIPFGDDPIAPDAHTFGG